MKSIAGTIIRWLLRHFLILLLIFTVLLLGRAGWTEWKALQAAQAESAHIVEADRDITTQLDGLADAVTKRATGLRSASLQSLQSRLTALEQDMALKRLARKRFSGLGTMLTGTPIISAQLEGLRLDAEIKLLEQERSYLLELQFRLLALQSKQANLAELERLRRIHQSRYSSWQVVVHETDALAQRHPVKVRLGYGSREYTRYEELQAKRLNLLAENKLAWADYQRQFQLMQDTRPLAPPAAFILRRDDIDAMLRPLRDRIAELDGQRQGNWVRKVLGPIEEVAPTALLVLLGVIFTPVAVKALFYFVLAPLATRRPPLQVLPKASGAVQLEAGHSAVSMKVVVDPDHELLVHAEFLQSSSVRGDKDTRWLLNWELPLTSLASGMVALTRIRTLAPETFVISATRDPFSEIGILSLAPGAALVMQPHNLVGVVQPWGSPVHITSHWRLNSLHAWLTLQLRYLAFHGPAQLIVQGCRGVRIERADAGRSINQAATIGFSANLAYSTRRCETFGAYLLGKQELLNDTFSGENGFYVYEEMPHFGKKTGVTGRGLEGFADSLLKVLGI